MRRIVRLVGAALLLAGAGPDWGTAAKGDLIAMHDLIRDNHPGPVDPRNPGFQTWLNQGEAALMPAARAASTMHDYQTVLRTYANGFGDGHLGVVFAETDAHRWPGFLARAVTPDGVVRVSAVSGDAPAGLRAGAPIAACGGADIHALMTARVLRPALNPHVPQRMRLASSMLMVTDADDQAGMWPDCTISGRRVALHWRPISDADLKIETALGSGIEIPPPGARPFGDTWLISLPSFYPQGPAVARMQGLMKQLGEQAAVLHAARHVVLDMRGNTGGADDWGIQAATALWGGKAVDAVEASMPSVIDWRVSGRNVAAIRQEATMLGKNGDAAGDAYFNGLAGRIEAAQRAHQVFWRENGDPAKAAPAMASPFAHPVYVLTTPHCASACLDFIDLLNGLPGVIRIGLETSSDTDYLEIAPALLPSGHATLHYAMKVYRERKRGADVSYRPRIAWPGGEMDDAGIVRWVRGLP